MKSVIKVGIFGSAFNPPTLGHMDVIKQAANQFDQILLVPSIAHPFAKQMLPFSQRADMLRRFTENLTLTCDVGICLIEEEMLRQNPQQPVYTFDLMQTLESKLDNSPHKTELHFIRGPDNADPKIWHKFYRADEIEKRWGLFTAKENRAIRSSLVRKLCQESADPTAVKDQLNKLVSKEITKYIIENNLYKEE